MTKTWRTLAKETLLDRGKFLKVENHVVQLPNGKILPDWSWVIIPDSSLVLAVTGDQKFLCFRQTKYALDSLSLAPVAGMIEPGETPLNAAKRELLEESGYSADEWVYLGGYVTDSNRGVATAHLFLALGAQKAAEVHSDDLEEQELLFLTQEEIEAALLAGGFKVLPWAATVSLSLNYLSTLNHYGRTP